LIQIELAKRDDVLPIVSIKSISLKIGFVNLEILGAWFLVGSRNLAFSSNGQHARLRDKKSKGGAV